MSQRATILCVDTSPGWGGALTSLSTLSAELERAGLSVTIASRASRQLSELNPRVHSISFTNDDPGAVHGQPYFLREWKRAQWLIDACTQLRPQVILANNAPAANLAAHLAARNCGIPLIQYVRARFVPTPISRLCALGADHTFAVGRGAARALEQIGARYTAVAEALDPKDWPTQRARKADGVFWCASLARWKGLELALSAYERLADVDRPKLEICYAPMDIRHPDAATLPPKPPRGAFWNEQPRRLDAIRASCNIFLHTSLTGEPFGRSLLESMAAGLCPVVPDHADSAPLVHHEQNGLLYAAGDREALTHQLRRLTREPRLAAQLGAAARVRALQYRSDQVFRPVVAAALELASSSASRRSQTFSNRRMNWLFAQ